MRIIGHGIDIETILGIKEQIDSPLTRWIEQFCSEEERAQADDPPSHYRYYAGRFAGKEAVVKALGTGFAGEITWRGIEILHHESGAPYVRVSNEVKFLSEELGITDWHISISYAEGIVVASVIAVGA